MEHTQYLDAITNGSIKDNVLPHGEAPDPWLNLVSLLTSRREIGSKQARPLNAIQEAGRMFWRIPGNECPNLK